MSGKIRQSPFAIVPIEAAMDDRLTKMHYRVLIALLSFRRSNSDTVFPWRETLAGRCGYSVNTVSRVTGQLVSLGWLVKVGNGGRNQPAKYRVTTPERVAYPDTLSTEPVGEEGEVAQVVDVSEDSPGFGAERVAEPESLSDPDTLSTDEPKRVADRDTKGCPGRLGARKRAGEKEREREGAREVEVIDPARVRKILADRGFEAHRLIQGPARRLITELREQGATEAEFREAIELAEGRQGGRPDSPAYYRWAVNRVVNDRGRPVDSTPGQGGGAAPTGAGNGLYDKDYTRGATGTDGIPEFLRGD